METNVASKTQATGEKLKKTRQVKKDISPGLRHTQRGL